MGKSFKKAPILKMNGHRRKDYRRSVRRVQKNNLRNGVDIVDEKVIINDYDYVDYVSICTSDDDCYCLKNFGRKKCLQK